MNQWSKKRIVGLGGSLGTGKDIVSNMLEKAGAFVIDAQEAIKHVVHKGAQGYQAILQRFGEKILLPNGQVNWSDWYQDLHADRQARHDLHAILAPHVRAEILRLIQQTEQMLVVVKATDITEFDLYTICNVIWVVSATEEVQTANLAEKFGWNHSQARQYIHTQLRFDSQLEYASLILYNTGSRGALWRQIAQALQELEAYPASEKETVQARVAVPDFPIEQGARIPRETALPPVARPGGVEEPPSTQARRGVSYARNLKLVGESILKALSTLLVIAYLTSWGLILAERGREHLPAQPFQAAWQALVRVAVYLFNHPSTYYWHKESAPTLQVVAETLKTSAGLLLISLGVALMIGLPLGMISALAKRKSSAALMMLISVIGISTPSFLVGMLLWMVNIWAHRTFHIQVLPAGGFGWDTHLLMPAVVLAMRPLAQIAQVTYVTVSDILKQDYIRTAYSKGLSWRMVRDVHTLPNILIPILTTLGSSLRFSLASLPVVEVFFNWPGVGSMLLDTIQQGNADLVTDLILSLGLFFLLTNMLIEFTFPLIDARLRNSTDTEEKKEQGTFTGWIQEVSNAIPAWLNSLRQRFARRASTLPPLPANLRLLPLDKDHPPPNRFRWFFRHFLHNPALILGSLMLIALFGAILFGELMIPVSPYQVHGVMTIEGQIGSPPYRPSSVFSWGTDHIGRDIRALVMAGGKRTLALAFFGTLARLLLGATFGILAGWQRGGWFDRLVTGAINVWAAFPVTLFAMILIQALGIQQGMWVFVVALSVVGWGEVAQFVRGQVITIKPQLFVEAARSVGSRPEQILGRHILPNLINSLIVLAALEMGGVVMLLAELGYLNIFMGGGFRVMIGEAGRMMPIIAFFSDVPEWSALIANVRAYWRSYPWMALYPGLAVFLSIITFNLFGEGLRRFLDDTHANLSRLFNRYTFTAAVLIAVVIALTLQASKPLSMYRAEGLKFDEEKVMQDIQILSSPEMQGRETGMPGADLAALYIAYRMAEIGIFPAGEHGAYMQHLVQPRKHLFDLPSLTILDESGQPKKDLVYKQDFVEIARFAGSSGDAQARVVGVTYGPLLDPTLSDEFGLSNSPAMDHIVIVRAMDLDKINPKPLKGILVIADETYPLERRDVYPYWLMPHENHRPYMLITPQVADSLLQTTGSSLAELDAARQVQKPGTMTLTGEGALVSMSLQPRNTENFLEEKYINVMGVIPGQGHFMGVEEQVIIVSAYYDGLGTDLAGTVYPGANDNASGVAVMLELARLLKESTYQPDKTVLFVAWAGGERQEGLSVVNVLNSRPGANQLTVETVIELSGVGYGTGKAISLGNDSSYRLVKLFQKAASHYKLSTTTRGRSPHYGMPLPTAFGGREAMTLSISWDGSDSLAHTPADIFSIIDPAKLFDVGRTTYLTLLVISRETEY